MITTPGDGGLALSAADKAAGIIRCDACPVLCRIRPASSGACDRYANDGGQLVRVDPLVVMQQALSDDRPMVPFAQPDGDWDGDILAAGQPFLTGIGAGTTYPDYKPAPFIVSSQTLGVDTVTVVTEGIFSFCNVLVKIDTDRFLGAESAPVRFEHEHIGHVTTAQYGSQMLSLGGVRHLTGGSRKEGTKTCEALLRLCNKAAVELSIDDGAELVVQAGHAPLVNGVTEQRMRVGCGSAAIGMFAQQFHGLVDEVIVVDDHITGVLSEHQAGRYLGIPPSGIKIIGRKSTPGRYFNVSEPGLGWGGTEISEPLDIIKAINPQIAWPGLRMLMTTTTGEDSIYCELDHDLRPVVTALPAALAEVVERIGENCEPSLCSVLFQAGAGGSLRAGVSENPITITRSVAEQTTRVTMGRRQRLRLPRWWHYRDGRRARAAGPRVRLRADAGVGRTDGIHFVQRPVPTMRRPHGSRHRTPCITRTPRSIRADRASGYTRRGSE